MDITRRNRIVPALLFAVALAVVFAVTPSRAGVAFDLPDLVPLQPTEAHIGEPDDFTPNVMALRFGTPTENIGAYPLEILGIPRGADLTADARQCVQWAQRVCAVYRDAAVVSWHEEHGHWHFPGFALYELRRLLPSGQPDLSGPAVAGGTKVSSCIRDDYYDPDSGVAGTLNRVPLYYQGCTSLRQGITPSWIDYYPADIEGQQILLTGVSNGKYALVLRIDPDNRLLESDETNNMAFLRIQINGSKLTILS